MTKHFWAAFFAAGLATSPGTAEEPQQFGKPLSHWAKALQERSSPDHKMAPHALSKIGEPALPVLRKALADPETNVRQGAAFGLQKMGPPAWGALPELTLALKDKDDGVRRLAASAIGAIGTRAAPAVPALIGLLSDPELSPKMAAILALGQIGPPARQAVPPLTKLSSDPLPVVAKVAKESLAKITKG